MASGIPLGDDDRAPWLDRLSKRAIETVIDLGYEKVIVSCSALKKDYRDKFRAMKQQGIQLLFMDLQTEQEELVRRMQSRDPYYMKHEMVDSQLAIYGAPSAVEVDDLPADAGRGVNEVIEEVESLLETVSA